MEPARHALVRIFQQVQTRTRTMSAEVRKAVSARMKRYWAERRRGEGEVRAMRTLSEG